MSIVISVIFFIVIVFVLLLGGCLLIGLLSGNKSPSGKDVSSPPKDPSPPSSTKDTSLSSDKVLPVEDVNKINFIQIIPSSCYLSPSEERIFKVKATNKMGAEVNPGFIQWQATGGAIDSQGKLIVDPRSKGTFKVTATSRVDNLTCSINYIVLPKLTSIEIITTKEIVIPGQEVYLELRGTDQTQADINIEGQPIWSTTNGEISSKRKLIVDLPNRIVYITAKISGLEAQNTIRVGDRPQKVVDPIYPIDIPNPSPKTTPTPNPISIPIVPEHDPEDELSINEPEQIRESSRLVALEIDAPDLIFLKPSQERIFSAHGIDQFGEYIDPGKILWRATGGKIDSQGKLTVENDAKGSFRVTVISSNGKIPQHRLRRNLLLIKISLKIFSWVLSHKRIVKDTASYFIQELCNSEVLANKIFSEIDTNTVDGILTVLVFDDIKSWVVEAVINLIISYLDKFIALCFKEEHSPLICSVDYIVLPEQKVLAKLRKIRIVSYCKTMNPGDLIQFQLLGTDQNGKEVLIKAPITWKTTGGRINSTGLLIVNAFHYIVQVTAIVGQLDAKAEIRCYRTYHAKSSVLTRSWRAIK